MFASSASIVPNKILLMDPITLIKPHLLQVFGIIFNLPINLLLSLLIICSIFAYLFGSALQFFAKFFRFVDEVLELLCSHGYRNDVDFDSQLPG